MKVYAHLFAYPPLRMIGSELMTSLLLEAIAQRGHEVRCATIADTRPYLRGGVRVSARMVDLLSDRESAPDVFVTHPELAEFNFYRAAGLGAKTAAVVHNVRDEAMKGLEHHPFDLIVSNSAEMQAVIRERLGLESIVVRPPTRDLRPPSAPLPRRFVTLVNLTPDKGAQLFYELAEKRPDLHFLGIVGGYGDQVIRDDLPNVTIMSSTDAMGLVLALTRVLIMPSEHESWGMVGCEALVQGVPVISTPLPGPMEALRFGAYAYPPSHDPSEWLFRLHELDDDATYEAASFAARTRGLELLDMTESDMDAWCEVVTSL